MKGGFRLGAFDIDLDGSVVHRPDGDAGLSGIETDLLAYLVAAAPRPVPRTELLAEVWGYAQSAKSRTVDTTLLRLRKKLEPDPSEPHFLLTIRGEGILLTGFEAATGTPSSTQEPSPIGRESVVAECLASLAPGRIVTLVGPGGVGKTTIAHEVIGGWRGATVFVDLSAVTDESGFLAAATLALDCADGLPEQRIPEALALLGDGLLVFDNFEQLPAEAVGWLKHFVAKALLVTSQRSLRSSGEFVLQVGPLCQADTAKLLRRQLDRLGYRDVEVGSVAARLDGLPLECRLVAPLLGLFGPEAVSLRVDAESEEADVPDRHRSLQATLSRSVSLLSDELRDLLFCLAVFEATFDVGAAGAVSSWGPRVMAGVRTLHRRSLLVAEKGRFRLALTVRAFARAQQQPDRTALAKFLLDLGERQLVEGPMVLVPYREDLRLCILEAAPKHAVPLGALVWDLAFVVGPMTDGSAVLASLWHRLNPGPLRERVAGFWMSLSESNIPAHVAKEVRASTDSMCLFASCTRNRDPEKRAILERELDSFDDLTCLRIADLCGYLHPDASAGLALVRRQRANAERAGHHYMVKGATTAEAGLLLRLRRYRECRDTLLAMPSWPSLGGAVSMLWFAEALLGNWRRAEELSEQFADKEGFFERPMWFVNRALLDLIRGDLASARSRLLQLPDPESPDAQMVRGLMGEGFREVGPFEGLVRAWRQDALAGFVALGQGRVFHRYLLDFGETVQDTQD